eukprot:scaffold179372_cov31-Tisochrysis_lutea.AAC.1
MVSLQIICSNKRIPLTAYRSPLTATTCAQYCTATNTELMLLPSYSLAPCYSPLPIAHRQPLPPLARLLIKAESLGH